MVSPMPTDVSISRWMPICNTMRRSARGLDGLEAERDGGGDIEMRRVLDMGLPGDRQRQHEGVQREDIEQRQ